MPTLIMLAVLGTALAVLAFTVRLIVFKAMRWGWVDTAFGAWMVAGSAILWLSLAVAALDGHVF